MAKGRQGYAWESLREQASFEQIREEAIRKLEDEIAYYEAMLYRLKNLTGEFSGAGRKSARPRTELERQIRRLEDSLRGREPVDQIEDDITQIIGDLQSKAMETISSLKSSLDYIRKIEFPPDVMQANIINDVFRQ